MTMLQPPFLANDMNGLALKVKTSPAPRISKHYSDDLANLVAALLSESEGHAVSVSWGTGRRRACVCAQPFSPDRHDPAACRQGSQGPPRRALHPHVAGGDGQAALGAGG